MLGCRQHEKACLVDICWGARGSRFQNVHLSNCVRWHPRALSHVLTLTLVRLSSCSCPLAVCRLSSSPLFSQAWTVISSRSFGSRNKVPQEAVPREVEERVAGELLRAFESAAGLPAKTINPVSRKLQLWGAGVPMNVFRDAPCVFDAGSQAGICGDWLLEPSVQGAALSGAHTISWHAPGSAHV